MSTETPEREDLRTLAVKRLKKKSDLRMHVLVYVLFNAFFVTIWAMTGAGYFWPVFPIFGWGIGVVANAWDVYRGGDLPTESQISHEMERMTKGR